LAACRLKAASDTWPPRWVAVKRETRSDDHEAEMRSIGPSTAKSTESVCGPMSQSAPFGAWRQIEPA
jgi:hypothetical protein